MYRKTVNILPIFIYIGFYLRATEFEFCSGRVQSLCYGKFISVKLHRRAAQWLRGWCCHPTVKEGALFLSVWYLHWFCLQWHLRVLWLPTGQRCAAVGTLRTLRNLCLDWLCVFLPFLDRIYSPVTLNWNSSIFFFLVSWIWVMADSYSPLLCQALWPSSARAVPRSGVATDCPRCFTGGRLHPAPLFQSNAGISICASSPAFYPELTPLPWHQAHKTNAVWAL